MMTRVEQMDIAMTFERRKRWVMPDGTVNEAELLVQNLGAWRWASHRWMVQRNVQCL